MSHEAAPVINPHEHSRDTLSAGVAVSETTPTYALSQREIRKALAAAHIQVIGKKNEAILAGEEKPAPRFLLLRKGYVDGGLVEDIDKARVMAEAERPYQEEAVRWRREHQDIRRTLRWNKDVADENDGLVKASLKAIVHPYTWLSITSQPRKWWRGLKAMLKENELLKRAWSAATVAGMHLERLAEATLPYTPLVEVSEAVRSFANRSDTQKLQSLDEGPPHQATMEQTEALIRDLHLDVQLQEQLQILDRAGLLARLSEDEFGIVDEDGNEYLAPTRVALRRLVAKNHDIIRQKAAQGFTRMLLVPHALPARRFAQSLDETAQALARTNNLRDYTGRSIWVSSRAAAEAKDGYLVRYGAVDTMRDSSARKEDGQVIPGWRVVLVKNMVEIPRRHEDVVSFGLRGEFVAAPRTVRESKYALKNSKVCVGEQGFTIQTWFAYALTELIRSGRVIDAYSDTYLLGSAYPGDIFKTRTRTPAIGWKRIRKKEALVQIAAPPAKLRPYGTVGIRTLVELS